MYRIVSRLLAELDVNSMMYTYTVVGKPFDTT